MKRRLTEAEFESNYNYAKHSLELEGFEEDDKTKAFVYAVRMEGKNPDEEFKKLYGF